MILTGEGEHELEHGEAIPFLVVIWDVEVGDGQRGRSETGEAADDGYSGESGRASGQ